MTTTESYTVSAAARIFLKTSLLSIGHRRDPFIDSLGRIVTPMACFSLSPLFSAFCFPGKINWIAVVVPGSRAIVAIKGPLQPRPRHTFVSNVGKRLDAPDFEPGNFARNGILEASVQNSRRPIDHVFNFSSTSRTSSRWEKVNPAA